MVKQLGQWGRLAYAKTVLIQILASLAVAVSSSPGQRAILNVEYRQVGNWQGQLDILVPVATGPRPALVYFHGGSWRGGSRKAVANHLAPYLARGFVVVSVSYRGSRVALAPAAVTDARCALHWVVNNAARYRIDKSRIVLSGHSAGGHLALMAGYLSPAAGLDAECRSDPSAKPAAVVAWNAPSDLTKYMFAREAAGEPIEWLQSAKRVPKLAEAISPISYAGSGVAPTISVHAIADPEIPHAQAAKLHAKLRIAGVRNELVTLQSDGHLTPEHPPRELDRGYARVFEFLRRSGVLKSRTRK